MIRDEIALSNFKYLKLNSYTGWANKKQISKIFYIFSLNFQDFFYINLGWLGWKMKVIRRYSDFSKHSQNPSQQFVK